LSSGWLSDLHEGKEKLRIMDVLVKTEWTADRAGMVHWRLRTPLQFAHWGFQTLLELAVVSHIYANGAAVSPRPI